MRPRPVASPVADRAQGPRTTDSDFLFKHHNVHGAPERRRGGLEPDPAGGRQLGYLSSPERPRRLTAYSRRRQYAVSTTEALGILALLPRSTNFPLTWWNRWFTRACSRPLITVPRPFPGPSPWEARGETSYPGYLSEACLPLIEKKGNIKVLSEPAPFSVDGEGNIVSPFVAGH